VLTTLQPGIDDLIAAWSRRQVAFYFAWTETLARYRRSVLGPFWLVGSTMVGVLGLGFVWSALLRVEQSDFVPSLAAGLVTWQLISGVITESAGVFSRSANSILNIRLPSFLISLQMLFRHLINFGHNLLVVLIVFLIYPQHFTPWLLLAVPGLLIVALSLLGTIQLLGFFGARFRDIEPLIGSFMPILFFLSPVIYQSRQLGDAQLVMAFNPIAHWIHLVRDPLLGQPPSLTSYAVAIAIGAVIWGLALWITASRGHRLPYWV
jgi:ABC-type polysaccharide/polyol phosphate export permease